MPSLALIGNILKTVKNRKYKQCTSSVGNGFSYYQNNSNIALPWSGGRKYKCFY